jgi:hypothetical protein
MTLLHKRLSTDSSWMIPSLLLISDKMTNGFPNHMPHSFTLSALKKLSELVAPARCPATLVDFSAENTFLPTNLLVSEIW